MISTSPFWFGGTEVVVLGATSGIGEACARLAARFRARLVIADGSRRIIRSILMYGDNP